MKLLASFSVLAKAELARQITIQDSNNLIFMPKVDCFILNILTLIFRNGNKIVLQNLAS
jgi:hypothetical protein